MTVILATPKFMIADRRVVDDDPKKKCRPHAKIFCNRYLVAGVAGNFMCLMALGAAVREGAQNPDDLADMIDEDSEGLCLTAEGRLWSINMDKFHELHDPIFGIGSGAHAALGYLAGTGSQTLAACKAAVAFAATLDTGCGDGFDVLRLAR